MPTFSTGDPLLDAARKKAAITSASSAQSTYESRTGDSGNTVSPNSYTQPIVTAPPPVVNTPAVSPAVVDSGPTLTKDLPGFDPNWKPNDNSGTVTTTPDTGGGGGQINDATAFNPEVLAQILASLEAQYGLSAEQLMADGSEVGRLYQFISSNLGRMEQESLAGEQESSLGRGILRSGIHLENTANVERDFAERQASAQGEQAQQLTYINNQLAQLQAQLEAEKMAAAQGFGQQGLDFASQYAATAPVGGFPGGLVPQAAAPGAAAYGSQVPGQQTPNGLAPPYPGPGGQNPTMMTPEMLALLARQQQQAFVDPYARNR